MCSSIVGLVRKRERGGGERERERERERHASISNFLTNFFSHSLSIILSSCSSHDSEKSFCYLVICRQRKVPLSWMLIESLPML